MCSHLEEEKDEVDGKSDKQRQQTQMIKIPGKVILKGKKTCVCFLPFCLNSMECDSLSVLVCDVCTTMCECICILPAGSCYECLSSPRGQNVGSLIPLTY